MTTVAYKIDHFILVIFSSSTAEPGSDISSSGQTEPSLISSTANGPGIVHSFSLTPQQQTTNEWVSFIIAEEEQMQY